jgi:hypothetical protein
MFKKIINKLFTKKEKEIKLDFSSVINKPFDLKLYKLYSIPYNKESYSEIKKYPIRKNSIIKQIQIETDGIGSGSDIYVLYKTEDNVVVQLASESVLYNSSNKLATHFKVNEDGYLVVENLGSGKGSGIVYIEFFE